MSHAKFPPSAASRWLRCGLSVKMAPLFPETTSAASVEGTKQHDIAAKHLLNGTDSEDKRMQAYLAAVRSREGDLLVEHEVTIVKDICWGTSDALKIRSRSMSVIDLKWGTMSVSAIGNPQLMTYGVGALREVTLPKDAEVELVIAQPNGKTGWPVKTWHTNVGVLLDFREKIMRAIDRGLRENPPALAGEWCHWCQAKLHCPEYLHKIGRVPMSPRKTALP